MKSKILTTHTAQQKSLAMANHNRRLFLKRGMASVTGLSLRALATGLPIGFLLGGHMPAYAIGNTTRSLILAMSSDGESLNACHPGSFPISDSDVRSQISRPTEGTGTINGNAVTFSDFSTSAEIQMGDTTVLAPKFWSYLSPDLLDRLQFFNLRTNANGHVDAGSVHQVHGALLGHDGRGTEVLPSAIFQELLLGDSSVSSVLQSPMVLDGSSNVRLASLYQKGVPLNRYTPMDIKELFLSENAASMDSMDSLYDSTIDQVYKNVKTSGTPQQKQFLDDHAASREQASSLGDKLGDLLSDIDGITKEDEAKAAVALVKANVSPVVVLRQKYSGDNHGTIANEVADTCTQVNELELIYGLLDAQGLGDSVNYANYDVFGRHLGVNGRGGRDHHNRHCTNLMFGSNIKAGIVGGYEEWANSGSKKLRATGINSVTLSSENPDIAADETLPAYCRTLMASVGITEERIEARLPVSKTVTGALL